MINVDGLEWLRPKWKGLGATYFRFAARLATKLYDLIITDADAYAKLNSDPSIRTTLSVLVNNGTYNFNFVNGNASGNTESAVPSSCASSGVRYITVSKDTVFPNVCYNYCLSCTSVSVKEMGLNTSFNLYPNPAKNTVNIVSSDNSMIQEIYVFDVSSKNVLQLKNINQSSYILTDLGLSSGLYMLMVKNQNNQIQNLKLSIE